MALNRQAEPVSFGAAMGFRAGGLVVNTLLNGIAGSLGWALGRAPPRPGDAVGGPAGPGRARSALTGQKHFC